MGSVVSMPVNSVPRDGSSESNSLAPALTRGGVEAAIRLAIKRSGMTDKSAAVQMGLDPGQWSRQLSGREGDHLWLDRLVLLPRAFWHEFLPLLASPLDMSIDSEDATEAAVARALEAFAVVTPMLMKRRRQRRLPIEATA